MKLVKIGVEILHEACESPKYITQMCPAEQLTTSKEQVLVSIFHGHLVVVHVWSQLHKLINTKDRVIGRVIFIIFQSH